MLHDNLNTRLENSQKWVAVGIPRGQFFSILLPLEKPQFLTPDVVTTNSLEYDCIGLIYRKFGIRIILYVRQKIVADNQNGDLFTMPVSRKN